MAYDNKVRSNVLYPRTFYALYIGPNNNGASHLIYNLSIEQVLTTLKYKPVPIHEDLIKAKTHLPALLKSTTLIATIIQLKKSFQQYPRWQSSSMWCGE